MKKIILIIILSASMLQTLADFPKASIPMQPFEMADEPDYYQEKLDKEKEHNELLMKGMLVALVLVGQLYLVQYLVYKNNYKNKPQTINN